ncbi:AAA family ATPase [Streptomyces erythrochromogenes]|uniref:AAA family ATPase n=1 Tax=Streptomyces erythrochromogenes TaxID=285574 RepID=UPI00367F590E
MVLHHGQDPATAGPLEGFLVPDKWDDFGFRTTFALWLRHPALDPQGTPVLIGTIKIARADQARGGSPLGQRAFHNLNTPDEPPQWFSLGDLDYYDTLRALPASERGELLSALGDIAYNSDVFDTALVHEVTTTSLLRGVEPDTVTGQYRRVAHGGAVLTPYHFRFTPPGRSRGYRLLTPPLSFAVTPNSTPPTNIHVLIGRNGVGKSTLLRNLAYAALFPHRWKTYGSLERLLTDDGTHGGKFVNVVSVSFSAFDPYTPVPPHASTTTYEYIGLGVRGSQPNKHKSRDELSQEFQRSLEEIQAAGRQDEWHSYMEGLESDPILSQSSIHEDVWEFFESSEESRQSTADELHEGFKELSSGHAFVLLTMTRLIEFVAERSLVLLDEPESHLHPPLLAGFVKVISDLLTDRNGVAVIATHSPVVLQGVPSSCVHKVFRMGSITRYDRPQIETYGENVGVLTHEVFGLEVTQSGFHKEVAEAVASLDSYEEVLARFGGQLGSEAKGLVRILLADKSDGLL